MAEQFADLVAVARADNTELRKGMKDSERIVAASATKIESRFAAMSRNSGKSLQSLTAESEKFKSGLAGAARAASLFGGEGVLMALVVTDIGITVGAAAAKMTVLSKALAGVVGGFKALSVVILGPAGVVAGIVALAAGLAVLSQPSGFRWLTDWLAGVKNLNTANKELEKRLFAVRKARAESERLTARTAAASEAAAKATRNAARQEKLEKREAAIFVRGENAARDRATAAKELLVQEKLITAERENQVRAAFAERRRTVGGAAKGLLLSLGIAKAEDFASSSKEAAIIRASRQIADATAALGEGQAGGRASLGSAAATRFGSGQTFVAGKDPVEKKLTITNEILEKILAANNLTIKALKQSATFAS